MCRVRHNVGNNVHETTPRLAQRIDDPTLRSGFREGSLEFQKEFLPLSLSLYFFYRELPFCFPPPFLF